MYTDCISFDPLKPHRLAKVVLSSNNHITPTMQTNDDANDPTISKRMGPSTVLDRAVMEEV
jgi:COP9 signalosome complex subunit 4